MPRNSDEVLRLEAVRRGSAVVHPASFVFLVGIAPRPPTARVPVPNIEPECAVTLQRALHFMEDLNEFGDVVLQLHLRTNLARNAVITKSPIGRTGDAALEGLVRQLLQLFKGVANDDLAFRL